MESDLEPVALTPQKQDSAWKHCLVYKYGDRLQMKCLYCRKMFKGGGITRVKEHLAGKKGQGTICDQVPGDVRLLLQQCIDGTVRRQRKRRHDSSEPLAIVALPPCEGETMVIQSDVDNGFISPGSMDVNVHNEGVSGSRTKQRTYRSKKSGFENGSASNINDLVGRDMDNLIPVAISSVKNIVHPSFRDREITVHMAVGRFLFGIGADFDAVNSANFQPMIDAIASGGFGVSAPTSDDLRGWILKNCVEETTKEIDECRAMWKRTGCSVLVEELNSDEGLKVLNFLVYCPEKVVFLKSVDASEILSSADRLFEIFREVVEEIGHANVVQVITKCDDHYGAAGKQLMHEYPSLYWVPCAAHCIDKILEEFGKLDWISDTIEQARAITRFIYNRSDVLNLMRKFTSGNDILQPGFSTSATDFATLCRIAELQFNLQAMVTSPEWNECSHSKEPSGLVMNVITDEAFWKTLTLVNHLTAPLLRLLRIVCSGKKPAMGYVYAAIYRAKEAIKTHLVNRDDYIIYWRIIDQWWEQQQHVPMHAAGFFLNPKFFYNANEEMRSEISAAVLDCIERLVPDMGIQEKIVKELNSYKNAAGVFGRNLAIRARDTMLPAEWWSTYGESCLNLSRFAIRILSQTCSTSVGCRRNQIPVEQIYQSKNSIEQKRLSDLAFVQYNMRLKQLDHESGDDTLDPLSSHRRMDLLKEWVSRDPACGEENGSSDWKLLESVKRTQLVPIIDETDDLGSGFDDTEIFKVEKEVRDEGYYTSTNTLEKVFT
uniref:BED-type domain-containing protein n=1 Tax=Noccaea caerulescens TaxID=107243 RepID=A0A1J3H8T5_NOCCA